jgi:ADP-heptose:LPS heptosyltransferase
MVIGKDTSSVHIASAFSVPGIVLFTKGVNVNQWKPYGDIYKVFVPDVNFNIDNILEAIKSLSLMSRV